MAHTILITSLTVDIRFLQKIPYILFQCVDAFLHTQHADFLIYIQHFFEEIEVVSFYLNCIACFHQYTIVHQFSQSSFISSNKIKGEFHRKLHKFSFFKHLTQQSLLT
ncbi:hypothetical protein EVA_12617 [gut metagenome]|uniref:Uncharacterized protein n=1 Tax=gut metagenome TaxID=749906 RepID=J9GBY9_9ZZZZ